jgi:hypothetical protein
MVPARAAGHSKTAAAENVKGLRPSTPNILLKFGRLKMGVRHVRSAAAHSD